MYVQGQLSHADAGSSRNTKYKHEAGDPLCNLASDKAGSGWNRGLHSCFHITQGCNDFEVVELVVTPDAGTPCASVLEQSVVVIGWAASSALLETSLLRLQNLESLI